jgi:hypothetical protein
MNKKTYYLFYFISTLIFCLVFIVVYLQNTKSTTKQSLDKKLTFLKHSTLPDLAISTEASYVRHRSLSNVFSVYKDDGNLREYFPSTFTYSHSKIMNTKKVNDDK